VYFGQVPPGGQNAPVLVFVHGLTGIARDWWGPTDLSGINDMYLLAYNAGFRTAFVTLQLQGQRGPDYTIERDAQLLQTMVPYIAQQYGVTQVDFVTHSKGGIDVQQAIYFNGLGSLTHNVFMLSAPNWGSPLAVQQCPPPMPNPPSAICEMTPEYMKGWEANVLTQPLPPNVHLWAAGGTDLGPPGSFLAVTGAFLAQHSGSNDGFVTVQSATTNPRATYLFVRPYNHDSVRIGHNAFPFILAALSVGTRTANASSAVLEPPLALAGGRSG
jgi:hypothetical protein